MEMENVVNVRVYWRIENWDVLPENVRLPFVDGFIEPLSKRQIWVEYTANKTEIVPKIKLRVVVSNFGYFYFKQNLHLSYSSSNFLVLC